jgi:hypothetical protein
MPKFTDEEIKVEFFRIQAHLSSVIVNDVMRQGGMLYNGNIAPSKDEIDDRLQLQGDDRPFLIANGGIVVPDKCKKI